MAKAYIAEHTFTGDAWLKDHAVIVDDGMISSLVPVNEVPADTDTEYFPHHILAPAFIDLQIYGAYDKLFSIHPDAQALSLLHEYCLHGGTAFCMPTVATNEPQVLYQCIDAIRTYRQAGGQGILGLHAEGPWINTLKRGAHVEALVHHPSVQEVEELIHYGKDVIRIITLAPEVCSKEVIELIRSAGIRIFAGHSNASYEEATDSFNHGITAVTHLYNAMSGLQHRSPGLVGATLDHDTVMASIIPDGIHVDHAAVRIAKKIMQHRLFAITDAVTTTTQGYYKHSFDGDKYTADTILSGSALTMYKALQNLVKHVGIDTGEALRMCSLYPAQAMQLDNKLGRLAAGYKAKMVLLPSSLDNSNTRVIE